MGVVSSEYPEAVGDSGADRPCVCSEALRSGGKVGNYDLTPICPPPRRFDGRGRTLPAYEGGGMNFLFFIIVPDG